VKIKIAPSIFAADLANIEAEIKKVGKVDMLHLDIMDGHFVPNISYGPSVVEAIRRVTKMPLDVHLMIANPMKYIPIFAKAIKNDSKSIIVFHIETVDDPEEAIDAIRAEGVRAGMAIKPYTDIELARPYLADLDMVLQMTVEPGFSGQEMIADAIDNIRSLREWEPEMDIQVDGGVNAETAKELKEAGANVLVAGNAIFREADYREAIKGIKGNA